MTYNISALGFELQSALEEFSLLDRVVCEGDNIEMILKRNE